MTIWKSKVIKQPSRPQTPAIIIGKTGFKEVRVKCYPDLNVVWHIAEQTCKTYQVVLRENPQPCLDPPIVKIARWPKTPGELEMYIGAECVRTIRQELLCVVCTAGKFIG